MGKPLLFLDFDPGPWDDDDRLDHRPAGGTISGRVRMTADDMHDCRRLILTVGWHTEGRGDRDSHHITEISLHQGQINPGEEEFPFRCELPEGPISYAGHLINIVWEVQARLDLAWKIDPKVSRQFYLLPDEDV